MTISGDNPIRHPEDDTLGRTALAEFFARQVLALDTTEGGVVGVLGAWGSGKTSLINLAQKEFKRNGVHILDFNPWMFSGTQQLVEHFFDELTDQLRICPDLAKIGKAIGKALDNYSDVFPRSTRGVVKILAKFLLGKKTGISQNRDRVEKILKKLDKPIVVVLDDIDRLLVSEIRDMFMLIRLTANFPNIIYVVAFDRSRVEEALAEQGMPGRHYLEKILQVVIDLPVIPDRVLHQQISSEIDEALSYIEDTGPFDEQVWPDVFVEIIQPLIRNMRDVRRYAAAIHGTVTALHGKIALADVLGLEAVRVFLPDVFKNLHGALNSLTNTSELNYDNSKITEQHKSQIDKLIKASGDRGQVVRSMINRLFPAARRHIGNSHYGTDSKSKWIKERRVAHEDILALYLERVVGDSLLAFLDAERAWTHMADRDAFDSYLRSLDITRLEDVISSLKVYEDQFGPEHVVPGAIVLLNLLPDLPERQRGMFEWDARITVNRVIYPLLKSINDPVAVEVAVRQILPELESLSSKMEIIDMIGYQENVDHKLVSEEAAGEFEKTWYHEIRSASIDDLTREINILMILLKVKRLEETSEDSFQIPAAPKLTLALLQAALTEERSHSMESRAVRRSPRLFWDALITIYGDEATLKARVENLKEAQMEGADELLALAEKHIGGWSPSDFGE